MSQPADLLRDLNEAMGKHWKDMASTPEGMQQIIACLAGLVANVSLQTRYEIKTVTDICSIATTMVVTQVANTETPKPHLRIATLEDS